MLLLYVEFIGACLAAQGNQEEEELYEEMAQAMKLLNSRLKKLGADKVAGPHKVRPVRLGARG